MLLVETDLMEDQCTIVNRYVSGNWSNGRRSRETNLVEEETIIK